MANDETASRRYLFIPFVILLVGMVLTYVLQDAAQQSARNMLHSEFDFRVAEITGNINRRLHHYEQILEGTAGLFAANGAVDRRKFAEYIGALKLAGKYPGIRGVGFSRLIPPQDKQRHIAEVRAAGFPDYDIRPAGERDIYSAIVYLEPDDWRNRRALVFYMYAEPARRAAMERARDEAQASISAKVRLVQETKEGIQHGFLMYLPVYRPHAPHQTREERRANLTGWVYAPFRMNDLMQGILGEHFGEISASLDLEIYDSATTDKNRLMFDSSPPQSPPYTAAFTSVKRIAHFGHEWTIMVRSLAPFEAALNSDKARYISVGGSAGSLLLALVAWLLVTGRSRTLAIAARMTKELRQSEAEQRKLNRALRLLSNCNMALVHAEEEYKLLAEICRLCVESGGYLMAWVGYAEHDTAATVRPIAQSGFEHGYLDGINITWADTERGQGPTGTAIRTGLTSVNQDILTNPQMAPWRDAAIQRGYRSSVALPLIGAGQVLGALTMYAREADAFTAEEVQLLEELASDLAYGIMTLRTRAEHAAAKEKVAFLAHFDPLTHLPNRLLLRDRCAYAALVAQSEKSQIAMLYLDMDHFQQINDALGHEAGDKVLVAAVERLRQCTLTTDTISRLGGDEFVVLLSGIGDSSAVASLANAILDAFADPVSVDGHQLNVTFSIGISLFPGDGSDFDTLLKRADTAVNSAKEGGRNTYRFYSREMNPDLLEQMRLTGGLLKAVRNREFRLHYQPQVDIRSRRIVGAEALIRWLHPLDGLVSPARFIPLAEQSGHIVQIGEWVLHEACRQARAWLDAGGAPLVVAVNLSALQFKRGNILELVSAALAASGLPAACLELELTESILLQDVEATMQTLHHLKALGVKLSIDDFGTGYSSLSYLKRLAVDKLKIDQSFVRDMLADADGAAIVNAIVQLGHSLQLAVIAEGVESAAQLEFLGTSGCDEVQGYLFSRPLPPEQFAALLERGFPLNP